MERWRKWFYEKDGLNYWGFSAYLVAGLGLFIAFFALLAHRWTIKPLAILLTVLSAAATYFISKYNVAIDSSMVLNTIHTDPTEVGQLLSLHMVPYVLFLVLLPVALILSLDITFRPSGRYLVSSLQVIGVALGVALACLYGNYNAIIRAGNVSKKYIVYSLVPINLISGGFNVAARAAEPYLNPPPQGRRRGRTSSGSRKPDRRAGDRRVVAAQELQPLRICASQHQSRPGHRGRPASPECGGAARLDHQRTATDPREAARQTADHRLQGGNRDVLFRELQPLRQLRCGR